MPNGRALAVAEGFDREAGDLAPLGSKRLVVSDFGVRVLDVQTLIDAGARAARDTGKPGVVRFNPEGTELAAAGWGQVVWLWRMPSGAPLGQLDAGTIVRELAYSRDGEWLASALQRGDATRFWSAEDDPRRLLRRDRRAVGHRHGQGATPAAAPRPDLSPRGDR